MISMKKILTGASIAALAGIGTLAATGSASAFVACNREGDCWHTESRNFDRHLGIVIHPDDWYFHQSWNANLHFRDFHAEHGYYRGGIWVRL
jgi:hypothetical protein